MNRKLVGILACMLLFASCSSDETLFDQGKEGLKSFTSFTAALDDVAGTRAYLDNASSSTGVRRVFWEQGDEILVFSDIQKELKTYQLTSLSSDNVATFVGEEVKGNEFYAVYAPNNECKIDKDNLNILHLTVYNPTVNNDEGYRFNVPMIASSSNNSLAFKQVMGAIHISIGDIYRLEKAYLFGYNYEKLGGPGTIDLSSEKPIFKIDEDAEEYNQLNGIWFDNSQVVGTSMKDIYFFIPPMALENGFFLEIHGYDKDGQEMVFTKSSPKKLVVDAKTIKRFAAVNVNEELSEVEEPDYDKTYNALMDFYNAMNGENWVNNDGWGDKNVPFSNWFGLNADGNTIYEINMQENRVSGDIPASIANLSSLGSFIIGGRDWNDDYTIEYPDKVTLPAEFAQLTNLYRIQIWNSRLSNLPDLSGMIQLNTVHLNRNNLSGALPEVFATLPNLEDLCLDGNQFTGGIPTSYFNPAGNWYRLTLYDNYLSGTITKEQQLSKMWKNLDTNVLNHQFNGDVIVEDGIYHIFCQEQSVQIKVGETHNLTLDVLSDNEQNTSVAWIVYNWWDDKGESGTTSDNSPFTVDQNGKVTGVRAGQGFIRVKPAVGYGVILNIGVEVIE